MQKSFRIIKGSNSHRFGPLSIWHVHMNMFASINDIPPMTLQVIIETKHDGYAILKTKFTKKL